MRMKDIIAQQKEEIHALKEDIELKEQEIENLRGLISNIQNDYENLMKKVLNENKRIKREMRTIDEEWGSIMEKKTGSTGAGFDPSIKQTENESSYNIHNNGEPQSNEINKKIVLTEAKHSLGQDKKTNIVTKGHKRGRPRKEENA